MIEVGAGTAREIGGMRFEACLEAVIEKNRIRASVDGGSAVLDHRISQAEYSLWREENALPDREIGEISPEEIAAIHQGSHWIPSHAEACPRPLDLLVFECATRLGARRAVELLQAALRVPGDGIFGPATRDALASCEGTAAALKFMDLCETQTAIPDRVRFRLRRIETRRPPLRTGMVGSERNGQGAPAIAFA